MTLAEFIMKDAMQQHWPPELLAVVLDKAEAAGIDLTEEKRLEWWQA